ncbi:ABC transporter permease [Paratissierella segnis]|jgi:ABC-type dipeptide/oligopeptide/nickel transport system permease subunit|uniref:ABC transporter permease n=1 Tax=Paratissierella segnis TaxID=2763679 RepID=A0A926EYU5_9FIRM|nr:ABC transporter permease [Paratissierella segnis]MBC8589012.1 ABC transporter permease [Paratissierella segnis]
MENKIKLNPSMFEKATLEDRNAEKIKRPSIKYWPDVWRRLKQNKLAMVGLTLIVIMSVMSIVGTHINEFDYKEQNYGLINQPPDSVHWFGTDELGRDLFTRVWLGTRYSLIIGVLAAAIDFVIGVVYGGLSGMASRRVDSIMMRIAEVIYSIPYLLIVILLSVVFSQQGSGTSMFVLILAMTLTDWVPMAILVRGQVLQLKESEYSLASESLGGTRGWILKKHIIPNTLGPILVNVTLTIPRAIFAEATLGFLGLGLQPPSPSLGNLSNDGLAVMPVGIFYQIFIPALFISLIMFSFNVLGDGLRDALDPRLRK